MLVENPYPQDIRIRNETLLLKDAGYEVTVIALRAKAQRLWEILDGIHVLRLPTIEIFKKTDPESSNRLSAFLLKSKAAFGYILEYVYFTTACSLITTYRALTRGFDVIHAHNPPDTLFLVALPFKLLGKKFVFDYHDLCLELYLSRYSAQSGFLTAA